QFSLREEQNQRPSCLSMKSDWSMDHPAHFKSGDIQHDLRFQQKRSEPESSRVSVRSDESIDQSVNFNRENNENHL
ncbi:hypothetical protein QQF64_009046, partial [Cirrhinus molitorella]